MEKRQEHCWSIHSYLQRKVRENSAPLSLCGPYDSLNHVVQDSTPVLSARKSKCVGLCIQPTMEVWRHMSGKLWTVARCSTSHNYADSTRDLSINQDDIYEQREEWEKSLPGMQRRHQNNREATRNASVNDMQVNRMIEQETGLQRLHAMYALGPDWMFIQEDTRTITTIFYRSVLLGFLLNVVKASQTESRSSKNMSPSQAVMRMGTNPMADSTRVLKEAAKGSLRLTAFAASLLYLSQSLAAYRNQSSIWEYSISTAVAVAFIGFGKPLRPFAFTVLGGAAVGALGGSLICSMMSSAGASQEQRTLNRIRQKLEKQRPHDGEVMS